jgi:hypothetical protein
MRWDSGRHGLDVIAMAADWHTVILVPPRLFGVG